MFELTSDFYKKVIENVQGTGEIVRDNKSSSYPVFELTGVNCSEFTILCFYHICCYREMELNLNCENI